MQIIKTNKPPVSKFEKPDLLAGGALLLGLLFILIAWYKFINIISILGLEPTSIPSEIQKAVTDNLTCISTTNINFVVYILQVLFGTSQQFVLSQQKDIQIFLINIGKKLVFDAKGEIMTNCLLPNNNYLNMFNNYLVAYIHPTGLANCIFNTGINVVKFQIENAQIRLNLQINIITNFTYYGAYLTYSSLGYITYRTGIVERNLYLIKNINKKNKKYFII